MVRIFSRAPKPYAVYQLCLEIVYKALRSMIIDEENMIVRYTVRLEYLLDSESTTIWNFRNVEFF